ncbi:Strictosidine synthase [Gracilaria domingensis]|nr:Strictosidine synthase [Gracilaria domingensis]
MLSLLSTALWLVRKPLHPLHLFGEQPPSLSQVEYNTGIWTQNDLLASAIKLPQNPKLVSPETAFVRDSDCKIFVTDARGIIWTVAQNRSAYKPYAVTGGALLGGAFDPSTGALYVCDSTHGLLRVPPDPSKAHTEIVAPALSSDPLDEITYCDDVHVTSDGKVYFTSATKLFPQRDMHSRHSNTYGTYVTDVLYGSPSGRVLLYDPETMETTQLADGIAFANGIAVHPSGDYALFAETTTMKIWKLWLRGDKCGERQVLVELPGFPDGISYDSVGKQFWVTLYGPAVFTSRLVPRVPVFIRRLAANLPPKLLIPSKPASMVAAIDEETGKVSVQYGDPSKTHGLVAAAHRCGDDLWLGILHGSTISRFRLPDTA